ncbi:hypothetical protein QW180_17245 [Vibrio sinaloensis]|nr:hypothetical protein [Vibrio sinaloensis]
MKNEYIQISEAGNVADVLKEHQQEKERLLSTIENYKKKSCPVLLISNS